MDRSNNTHCNSTADSRRPTVGLTHAKRFELSLAELQRIIEKAKNRRLLKPIRRELTLGEELGVPGFEQASVGSIPASLDMDNLEAIAHLSLSGQSGPGRAGIVVCRVTENESDA